MLRRSKHVVMFCPMSSHQSRLKRKWFDYRFVVFLFLFFCWKKKISPLTFSFFLFFFFFFLFFFPSLSQPIKEIARGEVTDASEIIVTIDMVAKLSSVETNAAMLQESGVASSLVSTIAATASQVRI